MLRNLWPLSPSMWTLPEHVRVLGELLAWRAGPLCGFLPHPTTPISPSKASTRHYQFLLIWQVERLQLYSKCLHHPDCRPFWASMSHVEIFTLSTTTLSSYWLWKEPGCKGEQETNGQRVQLLQTPETGATSHCWSAYEGPRSTSVVERKQANSLFLWFPFLCLPFIS